MKYILILAAILPSVYLGKELKDDLKPIQYTKGTAVLKGESLRWISGPFSEFIADLIWTGVVQRYGNLKFRKNADEEDWEELFYSTRSVSELDPKFFIPYYFAGIIFPWEANLYHEAIGLDKRGMIYLPQEWRLPFLIGFNLFYFAHKKREAAYYLEKASHLPGSPSYLPRLVARLFYESGSTKTALLFLKEMIRETKDPRIKEQLKKRYDALFKVMLIENAVRIFKEKKGRYPKYLGELVKTGILKEIPKDPYGGVYYWDNSDKKVKSTSNFLAKRQSSKKRNRHNDFN